MKFLFCLAVLFMPVFLGILAKNKGKSVPVDSTSSTIGNSGVNNDAGRGDKDNGQAGRGRPFFQKYILQREYKENCAVKPCRKYHVGHRHNAVTQLPVLRRDYMRNNTVVSGRNIQRRNVRDKACKIPLELHDSDVKCKTYPDKLVCSHKCQFGHAFSEGVTRRELECNYRKDKWTPDFEECKPYVDCGFTMTAPGNSTCDYSLAHGPRCNIICELSGGQYLGVHSSFWCDITGSWNPQLPFCASPGSGIELIPRPLF